MALGRRRGLFTLVGRKKGPLLLGRTAVFQKMVYSAPKRPYPEKKQLRRCSSMSYVKGKQPEVIFCRIAKPQRKLFRRACFCSGSRMNDSIRP
jgi:hypothetical protein